jgi:hypothetical protein
MNFKQLLLIFLLSLNAIAGKAICISVEHVDYSNDSLKEMDVIDYAQKQFNDIESKINKSFKSNSVGSTKDTFAMNVNCTISNGHVDAVAQSNNIRDTMLEQIVVKNIRSVVFSQKYKLKNVRISASIYNKPEFNSKPIVYTSAISAFIIAILAIALHMASQGAVL